MSSAHVSLLLALLGAAPQESKQLARLIDATLEAAGEKRPSLDTGTYVYPAPYTVSDEAQALAAAKTVEVVNALLAAGANPNLNARWGSPLSMQVAAAHRRERQGGADRAGLARRRG